MKITHTGPKTMPNYCPTPYDWLRRSPTQAGFDADKLAAALAFAQTQEIQAPTNLAAMLPKGDRHPNDRPLGPTQKTKTGSHSRPDRAARISGRLLRPGR